jgi:hypothetical protein
VLYIFHSDLLQLDNYLFLYLNGIITLKAPMLKTSES